MSRRREPNNIGLLLARVRRAKQALNAAVMRRYPIGTLVRISGAPGYSTVGIVHAYFHSIGEQIGVILEHGDMRVFDLDRVQPLSEGDAVPYEIRQIIESRRGA